MVKFHWVFAACLTLVIGGLWLSDVDESLPTSRLDRDFGSGSEPIIRERREVSVEPYTPRQGPKDLIPLPDDGPPLDAALLGSAWKLANVSQMQSRRPQSIQAGKAKPAAEKNVTEDAPVCSPLCGHHGWGECKQGVCVCPALYNSSDCLMGVELPQTGPLAKMDAKYVGDLTLNRRSLTGQKWVVGFLPERAHAADKGQHILAAVTPQLLEALPSRDVLATGRVYGRCAVVGSSGLLLHYYLGNEISAHDLVMRFNNAPKTGFELHVGNKTTLRLTSSRHWGYFEHYSELVVAPLRSRSAMEALLRVRQRFQSMRLAALSPEFVRHLAASFDFVPSVGLTGVLLALQRCQKVTVYGFQAYEEQGVAYQYYDPCARPADPERDQKEYPVLRSLARLGLLTFREPCIEVCHEQSKKKCKDCQKHHGFAKVLAPKVECPPCSFTKEGCRRNRHWAFKSGRNWPRNHRKQALFQAENATGISANNTMAAEQASREEEEEENKREESGDDGLLLEEEDPFKRPKTKEGGKKKGGRVKSGGAREESEEAEAKAGVGASTNEASDDFKSQVRDGDGAEEEDEDQSGKGKKTTKLRWPKTKLGRKNKKGEDEGGEDEEDAAEGEDKDILEIDPEDDDSTTTKKVWPEFPGKKHPKGDKGLTVTETGETLEIQTFTRQAAL